MSGGLKYKVGNLVTAAQNGEVDVIAHCCNCFNTMKSGIAPQIAKAFPIAKIADNKTIKGDWRKFGSYSSGVHTSEDGQITHIYNLYGQYNWWPRDERHLHYDALKFAMRLMVEDLSFFPGNYHPKIGLPKVGAGFAGGDWSKIVKHIHHEFSEYDVTIYVLDEKEIP